MNRYIFPRISHIDDVRPYVDGRPEFSITERDWYTVIRYIYMTPDTFTHDTNYGTRVLRECRGLVFATDTGRILSRPLHKIFNAGQIPETQLDRIDVSTSHVVLDKLDGSMIRPIRIPDDPDYGFRLGTKAGITDTALRAEDYVSANPAYAKFIRMCVKAGYTPVFEWCSRKDRVVVDYGPVDTLTLLALRDTVSGEYISYHSYADYGRYWGVRVVEAVRVGGIDDIHDLVSSVRSSTGREGVVLRYEDGHMVKIKSDDYVMRHRTVDGLRTERDALRVVLYDAVDDLVPLLPPADADRLADYQQAVSTALDTHERIVSELFADGVARYPDKRDFATRFVQNQNDVNPAYAPVLYAMYGGAEPRTVLTELLSKSLSSQSKFDAVKWIVEGASWD
jgi:RNA ligase